MLLSIHERGVKESSHDSEGQAFSELGRTTVEQVLQPPD